MTLQLEIVSDHREIVGSKAVHMFREEGGTIGRSLRNDWVLPDPERFISGQHATIDYRGGIYYLIDTSTNGVFLNDESSPIGKGNPSRLFNGDRLRFGSFEIVVSVDTGEDLQIPVSETQSGIREYAHVLVEEEDPVPADLVNRFLHGLGIDRAELHPSADIGELMQNVGEVLREFVDGTTQLLVSRADLKDVFQLDQTTVLPGHNNPIKLSANVKDSILQLLIGKEGEYLGPRDAVREICRDLLFHQEAFLDAMNHAFSEFASRVSPEELQEEFDQALSSNILAKQFNKSKYWDMYGDLYPILTGSETSRFPQVVAEEFVKAYERQIAEYKRLGGVHNQPEGEDIAEKSGIRRGPASDDKFGATDPALAFIDIDELEAALANDDFANG